MNRERALKVLLVLVGLLFVAGLYPLLPSLLKAHSDVSSGDKMMLSIYVTLGVFVLLAVRNPAAHRSLIAFTAWSSFAHGAIMAILAVQIPAERTNLFVAVGVLAFIGVALLALAPAKPTMSGYPPPLHRVDRVPHICPHQRTLTAQSIVGEQMWGSSQRAFPRFILRSRWPSRKIRYWPGCRPVVWCRPQSPE
jgi:hypothetical protein